MLEDEVSIFGRKDTLTTVVKEAPLLTDLHTQILEMQETAQLEANRQRKRGDKQQAAHFDTAALTLSIVSRHINAAIKLAVK